MITEILRIWQLGMFLPKAISCSSTKSNFVDNKYRRLILYSVIIFILDSWSSNQNLFGVTKSDLTRHSGHAFTIFLSNELEERHFRIQFKQKMWLQFSWIPNRRSASFMFGQQKIFQSKFNIQNFQIFSFYVVFIPHNFHAYTANFFKAPLYSKSLFHFLLHSL